MISIHDNPVFAEYHAILIPKAIEYSAGILDYFFRGRIDASTPVWNSSSPAHYTVTLLKQSGESFKDGDFTLWYDDADGNRSPVGSTYPLNGNMPNGILTDQTTAQITFASAEIAAPTKFILVYKGSIGLTGTTPSDSVDTAIAIGAKTIQPSWHSSFETGSGTWPAGTHLPEGWVVDFGEVDFYDGTAPGQAYEGDGFADLNGFMPGGVSTDIPVVPGHDYTLRFAYTRNPGSVTGEGGFTGVPQAEIWVNGGLLGTVAPDSVNSWENLDWQTMTYVFTATTTSAHLTFQSVDTEGACGVLVDAIDLAPN